MLVLAQQQLWAFLPPTVKASMVPFFQQAQVRLPMHPHQAPQERAVSDWMRKVRVISNSQPLLGPEM